MTQQYLFPLGEIKITAEASRVLKNFGVEPNFLVIRHGSGDWTDLQVNDQHKNNLAIENGEIVSSYHKMPDTPHIYVWVITTANRLETVVALPDQLF